MQDANQIIIKLYTHIYKTIHKDQKAINKNISDGYF